MREKLKQTIATLESRRALLGDDVVDTAIASLRLELKELDAKLQPQRKLVTVLFADLVGYTALAYEMDAENVMELVNALWERLDRVILAHGGMIDKHVGDAVMAIFGVPVARESDPERAVLAGLAMQAEMQTWIDEQEQADDQSTSHPHRASVELRMRVGINTGPVLFGPTGSTGEMTAIGDTVNIASRLESAAPSGGVLIAEEVWEQVWGRFDATPRSIVVKGREAPLTVYVVAGEKGIDQRSSGRGVAGIQTRTVGREIESARLRELYRQVADTGKAQVVTLIGDAGVGKSRLLEEFSLWLAEQPRMRVVMTAKAAEDNEGQPYGLVRGAIARYMGIGNNVAGPEARSRLLEGFGQLQPEDPSTAEFIGQLIGLDFSASPRIRPLLNDARQIRGRAFYYLALFFRLLCREQMVVLLLEDIHWADSGSLDAIEYLVQECAQLPLLIVCLARPDLLGRRVEWGSIAAGGGAVSTILSLAPLSPEGSRLLVGEILRHVPEVPAQLVKTITEAAAGNAFYIEELVKVLIDDGVIVVEGDNWRVEVGRLGGVRVPPTLTAVLQARMDTLSTQERVLLQQASVVGKVFWDKALGHLADTGQPEVSGQAEEEDERWYIENEGVLSRLVKQEFIEEREGSTFAGATEYHFHHAILHDVVYESVLLRRRHRYHLRMAEWLIRTGGDRANESAGLIGEHFARSERAGDAGLWYGRAADQAREAYLPEVAIDYYRRAIKQYEMDDGAEWGVHCQSLYRGLGNTYFHRADYDHALDAIRTMDNLAQESHDDQARAEALAIMSRIYERKGEFKQAIDYAEQAVDIARRIGSIKWLIRALAFKANGLCFISSYEEAEALCQEALSLIENGDMLLETAIVKNALGIIHHRWQRYTQSMQLYQEALDIFRRINDKRMELMLLNNLGMISLHLGQYQESYSIYHSALQAAVEIDGGDTLLFILTNLGSTCTRMGYFDEAVDVLHRLQNIINGHHFSYGSQACSTLAEALLGQGKWDEAQAMVEEALSIAEALGSPLQTGYAWHVQGRIVTSQPANDWTTKEGASTGQCPWTPEECFAKSVEILRGIKEGKWNLAHVLRDWAIYRCRVVGLTSSMPFWEESRSLFAQMEIQSEVDRLDQLLMDHRLNDRSEGEIK